uniref:UBA domain-containing protein n=1 Tax=Noctiluca scintillans TaxID=2966 RepID=A0A7S1EZ51_NOCSC|mmetsp:Transcript_201/g.765  ORF Transcript_201/g.765 Transcript_201/m.765 type:complete len:543 (+) Transcript_201:77-1705(+)
MERWGSASQEFFAVAGRKGFDVARRGGEISLDAARRGSQLSRELFQTLKSKTLDIGAAFDGMRSNSDSKASRDDNVSRLSALGFPIAACRHALSECEGNVQLAALYLIDESHSNELLSATLAAGAQDQLAVGYLARIGNLRGHTELNGVLVGLHLWDETAKRWVVQLPNGSMKSLRPRNLNGLDQQGLDAAATELIGEARSLLTEVDDEVEQTLCALSAQDLMELVMTLRDKERQSQSSPNAETEASTARDTLECTDAEAQMASEPVALAESSEERGEHASSTSPPGGSDVAADSERADLEKNLANAELRMASWEADQEARVADLERRERELLESQAKWREEAAVVGNVKHHEELQEAEVPEQQAQQQAQQDAQEDPEWTAQRREIDVQREELARLQEQMQQFSLQLEEQQRAQAVAAEEREFKLAEEEREQATVGHALREEKELLESQRRAVALLQRSLLQSHNQNGASKGSCVEMEIGDTSSQEEETTCEDVDERSDIDDEVWDLDWSTAFSDQTRSAVVLAVGKDREAEDVHSGHDAET